MRRLSVLAASVLLLVGCGSDGQVDDVSATPTDLVGTFTDSPTPTDAASSTPEDDTSSPSTPTESESATDDPDEASGDGPLPGEQVELPFTAGELGVVGVEADDVLNVRERPGAGEPVVTRLEPLARGLEPTGQARRVSGAIWIEIEADGDSGWVNSSFARLIDGTDDVTSQLMASGDPITAASLEELAEEVVLAYGLGDGYEIVWGPERDPSLMTEEQRRVVISDGPSVGDLGEVTIDVIDMFDDSIAAERLTIFARAIDTGFELRTVESTLFCARAGGEICA